MSNIVSESLNELDCHSFKMGDNVIKKYGNKEVKFTFVFNKKGKKLKDILEQCYQNEMSKSLLEEIMSCKNLGMMLSFKRRYLIVPIKIRRSS
jgi:hypothetical protein